jgi:hypothetical protein
MIYIVDLEAVETRYTGQWKTHVPKLLRDAGFGTTTIEGPTNIPAATSPGAFLNFGGTNVYKASQVKTISKMFCENKIQAGDHFLFTDAWHPGIINLKYMSELLGIPIKIHALWHAGSYDPADFLGRLIGNKPWVRHAEKAFYHAIDYNYFATNFHIEMFCNAMVIGQEDDWLLKFAGLPLSVDAIVQSNKIIRTGWPMEYMPETLAPYKNLPKRDLILFPHRVAPEKQVEIFRDLASLLPQYEFVVCQDQQLTKHEYHTLLGQAKIVFSASLQETLGIGCYEGALVGAIPMVPGRLSYEEMYFDTFKYPNKWTENWDTYSFYRVDILKTIMEHMTYFDSRKRLVTQQAEALTTHFFSADALVNNFR